MSAPNGLPYRFSSLGSNGKTNSSAGFGTQPQKNWRQHETSHFESFDQERGCSHADRQEIGGISLSPIPVFFELEILGSIQGWRMLHTGMLMNGMMAILLGLVLRFYVVSNLGVSVLGLGTITAIWGNFCFYLFGMFAPNHGVTTHANRLGDVNLPALLAFFPAFVGIFTLVAALIVVLCATPMDGSNVRAGNAS
jgi:hypothetical protein